MKIWLTIAKIRSSMRVHFKQPDSRESCVIFSLIVLITLASGCRQKYSSSVELSIRDAKSNADELIKVLNHYEVVDRDSLKLEAALYLIENMRLHFSLDTSTTHNNFIQRCFTTLDSLTYHTFFQPIDSSKFQLAEFLHQKLDTDEFNPTDDYIDSLLKYEYKRRDFTTANFTEIKAFQSISSNISSQLLSLQIPSKQHLFASEDLTSIKGDWLIDHIDNAFIVWRKSAFASHLTFTQFKEYILPYRCLYEYPEDRSSLLRSKLEKIVGDGGGDIATAVRRLNFYMYCLDVFEDGGRKLGNLGFYDILQFYKYDCDRHSEWTVQALNACGIPAVMEFTSGFFNRNKLHYGVSVLDTNGKFRHFTPKWQALGDTEHAVMFSKVFRRTFSPRESPYTLKGKGEQIPFIFGDPFIEDVTEQYHKVIDVNIPCRTSVNQLNSTPYLAIFTPTGWRPIGWGKINKAKNIACFTKVPVGACYVAGLYQNESIKPITDLFQVDHNGKVMFYKPSESADKEMTLHRKYPLKKQLVKLTEELVGAKIQGSTDSAFTKKNDVYTLSKKDVDEIFSNTIKVKSKRNYRFWRLIGSSGKPVNIAEIGFIKYTKGLHSDSADPTSRSSVADAEKDKGHTSTQLIGEAIHDGQNVERAFDNDAESYVNAYSITIDFGTSTSIDEIRVLPRNANNGIVPGNTYELFYYDGRWKSLGKQVAASDFLHYTATPTNAVFWLKNHSGGKEEQIFLYKDGEQIFLNSENISASNHAL